MVANVPEPVQPAQELNPNSSLVDIQAYLGNSARNALRQVTFEARNAGMARTVAHESALLTARSLGNPELVRGIEPAFLQASQDAGQTFASFFDEFGNPNQDKKADYNAAKSIIVPNLDNLLWGIVKTLQYYSLGFMVISVVVIGVLLVFSGDNTNKKSSLMGWGINILIGATLIFGATTIAQIVKQFVGGN